MKAIRRARTLLTDAGTKTALPEACPFILDELLAGDVTMLTESIKPE